MSHVVFLRAVNVGGHKVFRPAQLAADMAKLDVVNLGAAGTFVVRSSLSASAIQSEFLKRLPFKPDIMICPARSVTDLVDRDPFRAVAKEKDLKTYVSVIQKPLRKTVALPYEQPAGAWEIRLIGMNGPFVLSIRRPVARGVLYPNEVVEKLFGQPATTRNWNTILAIRRILEQ